MKELSVIIPAYNSEKYIERCLRSLQAQSLDESTFEIIVIDDGSTDATSKIIKTKFQKTKLITRTENFGLPYSVNEGIKIANSRYIVRVDSDDFVHEKFLEYLLFSALENQEFDAICCDYINVDDREVRICKANSIEEPIACGILFKSSVLIELGLYDEKMLFNEEKDLMHRFKEKGFQLMRLPLPLYRYRKHENNLSGNEDLKSTFDEILSNKHNS
jgi:glycosyltransferase involved in cell wall biosynthesis